MHRQICCPHRRQGSRRLSSLREQTQLAEEERLAAIADPLCLLEGSGKFMRHVKLRPGCGVDATGLKALIETAYEDMKKRLNLD